MGRARKADEASEVEPTEEVEAEQVEAPEAEADEAEQVERVQVPFAYASRPNGEVVQLVKGDVVDGSYTEKSRNHLRDIGFIA